MMPPKLSLAPTDFQIFLRPCKENEETWMLHWTSTEPETRARQSIFGTPEWSSPWDKTGHNFRGKYIMRHEPLLCSTTYKVTARYRFPLFSANINENKRLFCFFTFFLCNFLVRTLQCFQNFFF